MNKKKGQSAKGGRPTKKQSEKISKKIIYEARNLFINQGFYSTTMDQVVAACGISKDTLYRRFSSKEELFAEVVNEALRKTIIWFDEHDSKSPESPIERVRHIARWFLESNLDKELLALKREAIIKAMSSTPLNTKDPFTPRLIDAIYTAQKAGDIRTTLDPTFIASQLIATIVLGPMNEALMGSTSLSEADVRKNWFEESWTMFLQGVGNPVKR